MSPSAPIPPVTSVWLHLRAITLVIGVRLALLLAPSKSVLQSVARSTARRLAKRRSPDLAARRVATAVVRCSRVVPGASCLTQALAGQALLASYGHEAQFKVGVARDADGRFSAHAWLELNATPILGERGIERFTPLPDLQQVID